MIVDGYQVLSVHRGEKFTTLQCKTLSGGIQKGIKARLFPGNKILTIKSVKTCSGVIHLEVKGVPRTAFGQNSVILDENWPIVESKEGLFYGENPAQGTVSTIKGGVFPDYNKDGENGPAKINALGVYSFIQFPVSYPMIPGMEIEVVGTEKVGKMTLVFPGPINTAERKKIRKDRGLGNQPDVVVHKNLLLRGYAAVPPSLRKNVLSSWVFSEEMRKKLEKKILSLTLCPGGADLSSLKLDNLPNGLIKEIVQHMERNKILLNKGGWLFPSGSPRLAPFHSSWLSRVLESGEDGIRISSAVSVADRNALEELGRAGVIRGGSNLWLSEEAVESLCSKLLSNFSRRDKFTMADARHILGGSRARTLEILSILELDKKCRRNMIDESREVL